MLRGGLPLLPRDVIGYTKVITKCKQWPNALAILNQIRQNWLQPDEVTYGAAVRASKSSWFHALEILTLLEAEDLQLNSVFFGGVIQACEKALEWRLCSFFFAGLELERLESLSVSVLCSSLIAACGRASELRWALRFLDEAEERGAGNVITLSAAIAVARCIELVGERWSTVQRGLIQHRPASVLVLEPASGKGLSFCCRQLWSNSYYVMQSSTVHPSMLVLPNGNMPSFCWKQLTLMRR